MSHQHLVTCSTRNGTLEITVSDNETLMHQLQFFLPIASSCHGEGVCTKCKIKILWGGDSLSPLTELELKARQNHLIGETERLSCQTFAHGPTHITTTYW